VAVVTGASGFLGGHIVKRLLEKGYHVRGTVRSVQRAEELTKLYPNLKLYEADLVKKGSFDEAINGADYVFHTASPFFLDNITDPYSQLVEPALEGTKNVLESCIKASSVKRVVLTSSVAAIASPKDVPNYVYTENDWNLHSSLTIEPYRYSKRIAEETAWEIAKNKHFDLVVINPSFIVGPILSARSDATSIQLMKGFFDGSQLETGVKPLCLGVVDVRDVVEAHINAAEIKEAKGRYMVTSTKGIYFLEIVEYLRNSGKFNSYTLPTKSSGTTGNRTFFSHDKAVKELGINFTDISQSFVDMASSLIHFGIIDKK